MAALLDQLRHLNTTLGRLIEVDPATEVREPALSLLVHVVAEARANLPTGSTVSDQLAALVPAAWASRQASQSIRAIEALLVVGQLLAVFEHDEKQKPNATLTSAARSRLDDPRRRGPRRA